MLLGSGKGRPLYEYVTALRDIVAPQAALAIGARPYYPHQPMLLVADITELTAHTGFLPRVPFEEGIGRVLRSITESEAN